VVLRRSARELGPVVLKERQQATGATWNKNYPQTATRKRVPMQSTGRGVRSAGKTGEQSLDHHLQVQDGQTVEERAECGSGRV
jgi:hypothetical protein